MPMNSFNADFHPRWSSKNATQSRKIATCPFLRARLATLAWALIASLIFAAPGYAQSTQPPAASSRPGITPEQMGPRPAGTNDCQQQMVSPVNQAYEDQVVSLVNAARAEQGLPPLKRVTALDQSARYHAADLATDDYFSHDSYDRVNGQLVQSCVWSDRLNAYYPNWRRLAENIAAGYPTPEAVVQGWLDSPGHRANILSPDSWEIGVGYYFSSGSTYGHYWVQDFGRREGVYPVIINGEAPQTDNGQLNLYVYGSWEKVRLQLDGGEWSEWQPFQNNLTWQISAPAGEHAVTVEMQSGNKTATASDTIVLTQDTAPDLSHLPTSISFVYNRSADITTPDRYELTPLESGSGFTWQVESQGSWFSVTPSQGAGGHSFQILPVDFNAANAAPQSGSIQVQVLNAQGEVVTTQTIDMALEISDTVLQRLYIPIVIRGS